MTTGQKTVVFVSPYFPPEGGGLEKYVQNVSRYLAQDFAWRVIIITTSGRGEDDYIEEVNGISIYRFGYRFKLSNTPFDPAWRRKVKAVFAIEKPDLVNAHAPVPGLADVAVSVAGDIPCVITYHSDSLHKQGKPIANVLVWFYEVLVLPRMLKKATRIICSSDFVRANFLARHCQKSTTITPATDTNLFHPGHNNRSTTDLVFIASLNESDQYKGLWTLLKSMQIVKQTHPSVTLAVIGDGSHKASYMQYTTDNDLADNVRFLGRLESADIAQTLRSSSVFVLPTAKDSFPTVILEAMASGLPVITTNTGSIGQLVQDDVNGYITAPDDAAAIADKIKTLLYDGGLRAGMGAKNRKATEREYSWAEGARKTNTEFLKALSKEHSKPNLKTAVLASGSITASLTYRVVVLSKELSKRGYDVTLMVPSADKYNGFVKKRVTCIDQVRVFQPFQFDSKRQILNLIPYIISLSWHMIRRKYDLIYLYKPTPITVPGLIAKRLHGTPVILDMDDIGAQVMLEEGQPKIMYKLVAWCEKMAENAAKGIVVTSSFLRSKYAREQPGKPSIIVPNGVDSAQFGQLTMQKKLEPRIVFFGAFNHRDILDALFVALPKVVQAVPKTKVIIVGDGSERAYYEKIVVDGKLEKYVEFTGWLSHDEAIKHFKYGDIGYAYKPNTDSVKAASLMKVPQYMALGVVPLVSDVGDLSDYVKQGKAGYVCEPDNPDALAAALITALSDDKGRLARAHVAAKWALEAFDWQNLAEDVDGFLREQYGQRKK